ncbi:hypothetical protein BDN72DRAFT_837717 [Pluteus cervinus]|uniref:Uncharacterized protein n=1 Tax=Pluteus cervinus TaxID=181527 RepID=A0ACD3B0D1_9AGAR|nr:hypothetical protein BDN72DRAFT_837717 [Pluteus cervinus]
MFSARLSRTPPSSPPSSPARLDSSPPSSPDFGPIDHDTPISSGGLPHPFAASAKANRCPPKYEKKPSDPPILVLDSPSKSKRARYAESCDIFDLEISIPSIDLESLPSSSQCTSPTLTPAQIEAAIWDQASTDVIDNVDGNIQLGDMNLTHIPSRFIDDLKKFYVPPAVCEMSNNPSHFTSPPRSQAPPGGRLFSRVATAPAGKGALLSRAPVDRARTTSGVTLIGLPREEIRLFLPTNQITRIPLGLMDLQKLTFLSLRSNRLTCIPPEIVNLSNLHTLNIAINKLQYLPAEMLAMSLTSLQLSGNPFLEPPTTVSRTLRPLSDTTHLAGMIPMSEICLRRLFSPPDGWLPPQPSLRQYIRHVRQESLLRKYYELPIPENPFIPTHILQTLNNFAEVKKLDDKDNELITGVGVCPSPRHLNLWCLGPIHNHIPRDNTQTDVHPSGSGVFSRHVEERFTWEDKIAGQPVGSVMVPVKWRGCSVGCLDFLSPDYVAEPESEGSSRGGDDSEEEGLVALQCGAVQMLDFGSASDFGDDEFGEE